MVPAESKGRRDTYRYQDQKFCLCGSQVKSVKIVNYHASTYKMYIYVYNVCDNNSRQKDIHWHSPLYMYYTSVYDSMLRCTFNIGSNRVET